MAKFYDSRGGLVTAEHVAELYPGTGIFMRTAEETVDGTTRTVKSEPVMSFPDDEQFTEKAFHERVRVQRLPRR